MIKEESVIEHLKNAVDNKRMLDKIPEADFQLGIKGILDELNNPQQQRGNGRGASANSR